MLNSLKMKAKAIALQPKVMKRMPKYTGMESDGLKTLLIQKLQALKQHQDNGTLTDEITEELLIDQGAISINYFTMQGSIPKAEEMEKFMSDCYTAAGLQFEAQ